MARGFPWLAVLAAAALPLACSSSSGSSTTGPEGECQFHDPASKLCWQEPPAAEPMTWQDAKAYCTKLGLRLPKIQELTTLVRGCPSSACKVSDPGCTSSACSADSSCTACADDAGPGNGCYWDPSLSGTCDWYWSASGVDEGPYDAWFLYFQSASVQNGAQGIEKYVRCVRSEP